MKILIGHLHSSDKQRIFYEFYKFLLFFEIEKGCRNFLHPGSLDPGPMTNGARGPHGRLGWLGRLGRCPARPAPSHRRGPAGDGATTRETERERVQADQELTKRHRRGQLGRIWAGGEQFGDGELGYLRRKRRRHRLLRPPQTNCFDGEVEGDEAEP
jgi:hypothetical protein